MYRFCLAILFFAAVGVMPAAFAQSAAQPPLISVVKKGADKNTVSLSGLQASGPYGQLFVKTLTRDLELSGWFKVAPSGAVTVKGSVADGGSGVVV